MHTKGVMQQHVLRRVLRRFSNSKGFLEGFLEGACKGFSTDNVLRRVLRRKGFIAGALKVLRRQRHVLSQSTTPFACTLFSQFSPDCSQSQSILVNFSRALPLLVSFSQF